MEYTLLSKNVKIKKISEDYDKGVFEIANLYPGYGTTLGNALRRVLISSLPGVAITHIKIKGVKHEFSSIDGVMEDVIDIILNLKKVRFRHYTNEPQTLVLKKKGEGNVVAGDIKSTSEIEVVNSSLHIAEITSKNTELDMELTVEKGLGYSPSDSRKLTKPSIGTITIDSIFTPVVNVNFEVTNMRVGNRTDYNRLIITIETDGTISPSHSLHKASNILKDHLEIISQVEVDDYSGRVSEKDSKKKKATNKKDSSDNSKTAKKSKEKK